MWLFEQHGFTSTVAYDPAKDRSKTTKHIEVAAGDSESWLLVRARVKEDLEAMEEQLTLDLGVKFDALIESDASADYKYRALITRDAMKLYMAGAVDRLNYGSHFKEVAEKGSTQGKKRHDAMMRCWAAMASLQDTKPYGGYDQLGYSYKAAPAKTTKAKPIEPAIFTDVPQMVDHLTKMVPSDIDDAIINGSTDPAFQLWLEAESVFGTREDLMSRDEVQSLLDDLTDIDVLGSEEPEDTLDLDDVIAENFKDAAGMLLDLEAARKAGSDG